VDQVCVRAWCGVDVQGEVGELNVGTVEVTRLDAAIALAMRVGCRTADSKRCMLSALIIRRLRAALLVRRHSAVYSLHGGGVCEGVVGRVV
jgi:hypothetical protein